MKGESHMKKDIIRWLMASLEQILEPLASRYFEEPVFIIYQKVYDSNIECELHNRKE